ncbi:MAG: phosphoserine phosphatase SerB [Burkholderiaceae bacterium]|nr:phosphoserine phosphatase SerB [Burkholderiaceae bacterium]
MTTLTLQGLRPDRAVIDHIAAAAGARSIDALGDHAFRCHGVSPDAKAHVDALCAEHRLDYAFLEDGHVKNIKLIAMDMDSTLITIECIDEIADMLGLKAEVSEITEAAMRGEIEFPESLARRVALLKGLDASALQRVYDERVQLSPGAQAMLDAARAAGIKTLLVSGGFTFFTERLKERLQLDYSHANELEIVDGKLTGRVLGTVVDAEEKRNKLLAVCIELGIAPTQAIAMGDGANDMRMMDAAGLSVAFRAKPAVRARADIALNFVGLDGVLAFLS